jgi:hypothetical protein
MMLIKPNFETAARFNELLNLWDANETKNKQVTEETFKTLGQLFLYYHVESIFALTLLHKHFLLEENEILLETGSLSDHQREIISQPVKVNKLASSIEGFNWMVTPDKSYIPYEFRYEDKDNVSNYRSSEVRSPTYYSYSFASIFIRKLTFLLPKLNVFLRNFHKS